MITEKELIQAIEQCEAEPITPSKIAKLADFYIIYDHLFGESFNYGYSQKTTPEKVIETSGNSEFLKAVNGKSTQKVFDILNELMEATRALHPRMYDSVLQKISDT